MIANSIGYRIWRRKKMKNRYNVLKDAGVVFIAVFMIFSATTVMATATKEPKVFSSSFIGPYSKNIVAPLDVWLHYDDGIPYTCIGKNGGGTFEGAIRLTRAELADYEGKTIPQVKFYIGVPGFPQQSHSGYIKIYGPGTATHPGTLIESVAYTTPYGYGWFYVILNFPILINASHDLWISIEITHGPGETPLGADNGPAVYTKGDWFGTASSWTELHTMGLNYNWCIYGKVTNGNTAPATPQKPSGQTQGKAGVKYNYTTVSTDPDNDSIYYVWDWGDGSQSTWGPYDSGGEAKCSHSWNTKGSYEIKVKAKDVYGALSNWSEPLPVSMPQNYLFTYNDFFQQLFERFPHAFPILRQLLGY
jgi:hypothetical protein